MNDIAKILIGVGAAFVALGVFLALVGKVPGFGKLPGDILIKKENFTFYFPLATSVLISLLISFIFFILNRR